MHRRLDQLKKHNARAKTSHAQESSERTDVENLFLDCVDECKKDLAKKRMIGVSKNYPDSFFRADDDMPNTEQGAPEAVLEQAVTNKDVLISLFEMMFGSGGYMG